MAADKTMPSFSSCLRSPVIHIAWGLVCMGLSVHGQMPLMIMLYFSVLVHVALVFVSSDDVTSAPRNANLVLTLAIAEYFVTCYCVTRTQNFGFLLKQGVFLAVTQILVYWIYLMTSPDHVTHTIRLGEGRGRKKMAGKDGGH